MSVRIALGGPARETAERVVARLVGQRVASRIAAQDPSVLPEGTGPEALAWTESVADAVPLVDAVAAVRHALRHQRVDRVVVARADGGALAAAMIARTIGGDVVTGDADPGTSVFVADGADSGFVAAAADALATAGADPVRLVVLGSGGPAGASSAPGAPRVPGAAGVFGAAALVPAALAGADLQELLDEAESEALNLAIDDPANNALLLGAVLAAADGVAIAADGTHIVGFPVWASELLAETPGLEGAVAVRPGAAGEADGPSATVVRLVEDAGEHDGSDDVLVSGTLGELALLWLTAAAVASVVRAEAGAAR